MSNPHYCWAVRSISTSTLTTNNVSTIGSQQILPTVTLFLQKSPPCLRGPAELCTGSPKAPMAPRQRCLLHQLGRKEVMLMWESKSERPATNCPIHQARVPPNLLHFNQSSCYSAIKLLHILKLSGRCAVARTKPRTEPTQLRPISLPRNRLIEEFYS